MSTEMRVHLADNNDIGSLRAWLENVPDVSAKPVPRLSHPGQQDDVWDFLNVSCGTSRAVTAAVNAVATWIERKPPTRG